MGIDLQNLHIRAPSISEMRKEEYDLFFN